MSEKIVSFLSGFREIIVRIGKRPKASWKIAQSGRMRSRSNKVSLVTIDAWGGTSVNPSQVFRTQRGREDLDAMASLAQRLKIAIPAAGDTPNSDKKTFK
jgi:hypothetical protein